MERRLDRRIRPGGAPVHRTGILTGSPRDEAEPLLTPESWATSDAIRRTMIACRSRDTAPELAVRSLLHRMGLRYRVAARPLPYVRRTADIVFRRESIAVFIDGCYWHGCPEHYVPASTNSSYWHPKIDGNRARDLDTNGRLSEAGWTVLRYWEHEPASEVAGSVASAVLAARADRT